MCCSPNTCLKRPVPIAAQLTASFLRKLPKRLLEIPSALAQNSGMDPATTVANLRQAAEQGSTVSGIDAVAKSIGDVSKLGVLESRVVKEALIKGAFEAVMVLTRIDGIVTNKPRQRNPDMRNH